MRGSLKKILNYPEPKNLGNTIIHFLVLYLDKQDGLKQGIKDKKMGDSERGGEISSRSIGMVSEKSMGSIGAGDKKTK